MSQVQSRRLARFPGGERPPFRCLCTAADGIAKVSLGGELDIATVPELDRALSQAHRHADIVVLDLRKLEFIDSTGAHLMVHAHRRIHAAGGRLITVRGTAEVEWLLALTGTDQLLEMVDHSPDGAPPRMARSLIGDPGASRTSVFRAVPAGLRASG